MNTGESKQVNNYSTLLSFVCEKECITWSLEMLSLFGSYSTFLTSLTHASKQISSIGWVAANCGNRAPFIFVSRRLVHTLVAGLTFKNPWFGKSLNSFYHRKWAHWRTCHRLANENLFNVDYMATNRSTVSNVLVHRYEWMNEWIILSGVAHGCWQFVWSFG